MRYLTISSLFVVACTAGTPNPSAATTGGTTGSSTGTSSSSSTGGGQATLDTSFGENSGMTTSTFTTTGQTISLLALDTENRLYVAATGEDSAAVARYTALGELDTSYNGTGVIPLGGYTPHNGIGVDAAGEVFWLVASGATWSGDIGKFDASGKSLGTLFSFSASSMAVDPTDGSVYVAGNPSMNAVAFAYFGPHGTQIGTTVNLTLPQPYDGLMDIVLAQGSAFLYGTYAPNGGGSTSNVSGFLASFSNTSFGTNGLVTDAVALDTDRLPPAYGNDIIVPAASGNGNPKSGGLAAYNETNGATQPTYAFEYVPCALDAKNRMIAMDDGSVIVSDTAGDDSGNITSSLTSDSVVSSYCALDSNGKLIAAFMLSNGNLEIGRWTLP